MNETGMISTDVMLATDRMARDRLRSVARAQRATRRASGGVSRREMGLLGSVGRLIRARLGAAV